MAIVPTQVVQQQQQPSRTSKTMEYLLALANMAQAGMGIYGGMQQIENQQQQTQNQGRQIDNQKMAQMQTYWNDALATKNSDTIRQAGLATGLPPEYVNAMADYFAKNPAATADFAGKGQQPPAAPAAGGGGQSPFHPPMAAPTDPNNIFNDGMIF